MLLWMGLSLCLDRNCRNNKKISVSIQKAMDLQHMLHTYCILCIENGLDYTHINHVSWEQNEKVKKEESSLLEEALFLQKIKRRGLSKRGNPAFGIFANRQYEYNEKIGDIGGIITSAIITKKEEETEEVSVKPNRYFLLRDKKLLVDAQEFGNISRFIRRSCRPNVKMEIEPPKEEWMLNPPLKKSYIKRYTPKIVLSAISNIYHNTELFIDSSHSIQKKEKCKVSRSSGSDIEYLDKCSCTSSWTCLFEKSKTIKKTLPFIHEKTQVSFILTRIHKYMLESTEAYTKQASSITRMKKCIFVRIP
ncbi:hypothetical protein NEFER03_0612 [Nematocida sp. LUAm3]|nr:hypothetical protein NEFER03_0612 [Nematocida sp. LUAm3]KAI5175579.1 hypothetical protein NEFER02_1485 [Nematocida sp. LUAm2]KAI5178391.1 hypothetical protein NEFER01_1538 [Nematocida sp. LUAm1]